MDTSAGGNPQGLGARMAASVARYGLSPAHDHEMDEVAALTARLIPGRVADAEVMRRVQRRCGGAAIFVAYEDGAISGYFAFLPLSAVGLAAIRAGVFDGVSPASEHIVGPEEYPSGMYGWGMAATGKPTSRRLFAAMDDLQIPEIKGLPCFAMAATAKGEQISREKYGFSDQLPSGHFVRESGAEAGSRAA